MTNELFPRTEDGQDITFKPVKKKKKKKTNWTFPKSIWYRNYRFENDTILKQCFEEDWQHNKIPKFVKKEEDIQEIKHILWKNYKHIKNVYKYYASWNP